MMSCTTSPSRATCCATRLMPRLLVLALALAALPGAARAQAGGAEPASAKKAQADEGPTSEQVSAAVAGLKSALASKESAQRIAALRGAAAVPHADVAKAVAPALKDSDADVQVAAMEALGSMRAPEALKELQRFESSHKKLREDARLYSTLLKEIARHGSESSIEVLSKDPWENTDATVVRARIFGLGNIRDKKAVEALLSMMNLANPLPGEDSPFMPDFRIALARLTGTDQTTNKSMWQKWWNDNKKEFKVAAEPLEIPAELQAKWDEYWATDAPKAPASTGPGAGEGGGG
jgi:hypothetical protein